MNLQHLRYFLILAERKNYQMAADELFITQPALTKAMQKLEEELEVPLFEKTGKENRLTKFGLLFYKYAKDCLSSLDEGLVQLKMLSQESEARLRIGAIYSCATQCVPISFHHFSINYPDAEFTCRQSSSDSIIQSLADGSCNLGFISDSPLLTQHPEISRIKLFAHRAMLAVPEDHPLAGQSSTVYSAIADEVFVQYTEDCGNYTALKNELQTYGLEMPKRISVRCDSEDTVLSAVQKGLGVGFVSDTNFNRQQHIHYVNIDDIYLYFPVYLAWNTNVLTTPIVQSYKNYVLRAYHLGNASQKP
ncbi:MAG: LysR family transcriptional regulator [Ndongobacter sp.]|nr:LysR family transcriptional regulator [Ndongobacter sp.]